MDNAKVGESLKLPTPETMYDHPYPKDWWLRMVGTMRYDKEQNRKFVTGLHIITKSGKMACDCEVDPADGSIYAMEGVDPRHRGLLCERSEEYLAVIFAREFPEAVK